MYHCGDGSVLNVCNYLGLGYEQNLAWNLVKLDRYLGRLGSSSESNSVTLPCPTLLPTPPSTHPISCPMLSAMKIFLSSPTLCKSQDTLEINYMVRWVARGGGKKVFFDVAWNDSLGTGAQRAWTCSRYWQLALEWANLRGMILSSLPLIADPWREDREWALGNRLCCNLTFMRFGGNRRGDSWCII